MCVSFTCRRAHLPPRPAVSRALAERKECAGCAWCGVRGKQMDEARDLKCADYGMH